MKRYILIIICFFFTRLLPAQTGDTAAAKRIMDNLMQRYLHTPLLSFDVLYRYSSEANPAQHLDSLHGQYRINGRQYWYLLDSTELLSNGEWAIALYREDKLMYISKPSAAGSSGNPMAMADSLLAHMDGLRFAVSHSGGHTLVTINFEKRGPYKRIIYDIDDNTGLLARMQSIVRAEELYDPSVRGKVTPGDTYAVVEALFGNYHGSSFDADIFNTARYFKYENGEYNTVSPYDQYKIFLGKPGL